MHKNIGNTFGLYPTPVTIVGMKTDDSINWINIAHIGIIGVNRIMISSNKVHYSNQYIKKNKFVSINLVDKPLLEKADYVGIVSGKNIDKSKVFDYYISDYKEVPIISNSPIAMECELVDIYETDTHDNFIFTICNTFVKEEVLNDDNKIDFIKASPILFEMPTKTYISLGDVVGKCWSDGKDIEF